ncbi:hypothetical protein L6452_38040 [Arctium lappa]|uniref:Uncharacterized protein n=1 Tax=Arctium lappa TaxID=4217 RepID=A0ACB8Y4N4_ARCLA|nr:hypothetical protein L6452_38040 [Arctium lappa]
MAGVTAARFQTTRTMVRIAWGLRVYGTNPRPSQVRFVTSPSSSESAKREIEELKKVTNQMKEKAASHAGCVASQSKEATRATDNIAEKAKQTAKEAWSATKDAAQKVQNTVAGKVDASATTVKDNIETAKRRLT